MHPKGVTTNSTRFWKRGVLGTIAAIPLALALAKGTGTRAENAAPSLMGFDAPEPVRAILRKSCADCHSQETKWPWYASIPPVSWEIRSDVDNARAVMDLSAWKNYSDAEQRSFALQIARATRTNLMPPSRYLFMHHAARLTEDELDTLTLWARSQNHK